MLAFGLVASAGAQDPGTLQLNDSEAPGSVLVFPKFVRGSFDIDGILHPKTEIEVGVTCPRGELCFEGQRVKLMAHWVCPGSQSSRSKFICKETDFVIQTTVAATVTFNPDNNPPAVGFFNSTAPPQGGIRVAPCQKGYLVVWVIDQFDRPIKWDGLVGTATLRPSATAVDAYNAIPIQAVSTLAHAALTDVDGQGDLDFDGVTEYKAVTGAVTATVRYDSDAAAPAPPAPGRIAVNTHVTFLTLDVFSNRPNAPTFVDLVFYNQFEVPTSTFVEFICWGEFLLSKIDENLSQGIQGTRKGLFESGPAEKVDIFGIGASEGPVTLLGIVETKERNAADTENARSFSYSLNNDGIPVPTVFVP